MFISLVLHIVILFLQTKESYQRLIFQWSPLTSLSRPLPFQTVHFYHDWTPQCTNQIYPSSIKLLISDILCTKKLVTKSVTLVHLTYRTSLKLTFRFATNYPLFSLKPVHKTLTHPASFSLWINTQSPHSPEWSALFSTTNSPS